MTQMTNASRIIVAGVILLALSMPALAGMVGAGPRFDPQVPVRFDPPAKTVNLGDTFTVNLVADITPLVVGWGLDVSAVTPGIVSVAAPPVIGPSWVSAYSPDGDGLAGLAYPDSVSGPGVLLATLTFHADAIGESDLLASVSPTDGTEGFALDPIGFATLAFEPSHLIVIPEPFTAMMLCVMAGPLVSRRRPPRP